MDCKNTILENVREFDKISRGNKNIEFLFSDKEVLKEQIKEFCDSEDFSRFIRNNIVTLDYGIICGVDSDVEKYRVRVEFNYPKPNKIEQFRSVYDFMNSNRKEVYGSGWGW
ncbi:hypothetical protein HOD29_06410 [archaeon]|jgi:hypothetical protein|nr:hypothetical protein [archaeon]